MEQHQVSDDIFQKFSSKEFLIDGKETIVNLYKKANRNPYENGLLFVYAWKIAKDIECYKDHYDLFHSIGLELNNCFAYPEMQTKFQARLNRIIAKNIQVVNDIIDFAFENVYCKAEPENKKNNYEKIIEGFRNERTQANNHEKA